MPITDCRCSALGPAETMVMSNVWGPLTDPDFNVTTFFEVEYRKKRRVLKTKHNRKLCLTHGMVLCLVTLTDL